MERVDITRTRHADRQRWRTGGLWDPATTVVTVGELDAGRWFVSRHRLGDAGRAVAYAGARAEWLARRTARCWMRTIGGTWVEA